MSAWGTAWARAWGNAWGGMLLGARREVIRLRSAIARAVTLQSPVQGDD